MLGQVIERFDSDFYKVWSRYAEKILNQVESGLKNISFEGNKPPEITQLEILIKLAKVEKDKSAYIKHVTKIQELLEILANKDFKNVPANSFFFQARRSMNWLCRSLISDWIKYGEALLNPAAKPEIKSELGFAQKFIIKQGVKKLNRQMLSSLNNNAVKLLTLEIQNMPKVKLGAMEALPPDSPQQSLLAQILPPDQYYQLKSQINVVSMEDAAKYWSEQLYGSSFECYYSQIARLTDILIKAEKIAADLSQDPKESKEACQKILRASGFADLATKEGQALLNAVAKQLGFQDAKTLHSNYLNLAQLHEFEKLRKTKQEFMAFANRQDTYRENDPLEKTKRIFQEEYARVLKTEKKGSQNNLAYATTICYCGVDYVANLEGLQKQKNLVQMFGANVIDARQQQTNVGFFEKFVVQAMLFAAQNFSIKDRMDAFLLRSLNREEALYERKMNYASETINQAWREHTSQEEQKSQKRRNKIVSDLEGFTEEERTERFITEIQAYKKLWKERASTFQDEEKRAKLSNLFEKKNADFIFYRNTLDVFEGKKLSSLTPAQLKADVQQREEKIAQLKGKMSKMEDVMTEYNLHETKSHSKLAKERSFFKKIIDQTPWAKSKKRSKEKSKAKLATSADIFERIGLELEIENNRLQKARNQSLLFEQYQALEVADIRNALPKLVESWNLLKLQNQAFTDVGTLQRKHQRQLDLNSAENQLQTLLKCLNIKLSSQEEQQKLIQQGSLTIQSFINDLKTQQNILGSNEDLNKAILLLTKLESQSTKLKQAELIKVALQKSDIFFNEEYDISKGNDPFVQFLDTEKELVAHLSPLNQEKLIVDLKEKFTSLLKQKSETLDRKTLENILFYMDFGALSTQRFEKTSENIAFLSTYQTCSAKIKSLLQAKYSQIKALDPDDQRAAISQLDADLIHLCQHLKDDMKEKENLKQSYESMLTNPFGLVVSVESVEHAENKFVAKNQTASYFMAEFSNILSIYAAEASSYYPTLPLDILNNHIQILKDKINKLQSFDTKFLNAEALPHFNKIIESHQEILDLALNQEKNHLDHSINAVNTLISNLQQNNLHLGVLQDSILQKLNTSYQFDESSFTQFTELLNKAEKDYANIQKAFSNLESKDLAKSPQWPVQKMAFEAKLSFLQEALNQKKQLQKDVFVLYDAVQKGKPVTQEIIDPSHLGKAFVLAIAHNNEAATETILTAAHKITMQDLAIALQKAASKGNLVLVNKILKSRNDLTFTHADLLLTLKAALENKHYSIAGKIILERAFEFDNELPSLLASSLPQQTALSPLSRNWGQFFVDNDGNILTQIRDCYRFIELLAKSESETGKDFSPSELEQVQKRILTPLKSRYFENESRKNSQLEKWENELAPITKNIEVVEQAEEMEPYLVNTPEPIQEVKSKKSMRSSTRIQFNQSVRFDEQADKLEQTLRENSWNKEAIQAELIELRHLAGDVQQDKFSQTLSEALNYCAHHGKLEALQTILNFLEDSSLKRELAFNALRQAMDAEQAPIVAWLLEKNAQIGRVEELQAHLKSKNEMHSSGISPIAYQVLMHVSVSANPALVNMVTKIANENKPEKIPAVRKGNFQRFFADTDGPHLEELRTAYIFCEAAFKKQQSALYLKFRNPLDNLLLEKTPKEFTPQEVEEFTQQLQDLERVAQLHKTRILEIKQQYADWVKSHYDFQNKERMSSCLADWENAIAAIVTVYDKTLAEDIKHGKKILKECQSPAKKMELPPERKRTQRTDRSVRSQRTVSQRPPRPS